MNPIISGEWFEPSEQDKRRMLGKVDSNLNENNKKAASNINRLRGLILPFYPGTTLYEGQFSDNQGNIGLFTFIDHKNGVSLINDKSDVLHNLNKSVPLVLNNSNQVEMYLKFFCAAITGEDGNFLIVEDVSDIPWLSTATKEDKEITAGRITPLKISKNSDGTWAASGTVIYSDSLFSANFKITSDGKVEMVDDKPVVKTIPLKRIVFDGPIRKEVN